MRLVKEIVIAFHELVKQSARKETPPRYIIESLGDFADVPAGRIDAFLVDFMRFMEVLREQKQKGIPVVKRFVWVDDGKRDEQVTIGRRP